MVVRRTSSLLNTVYPAAESRSESADAHDYVAALVQAAYHGAPRAGFASLAARLSGRPWSFAPPPPSASYWSLSRSFNEYRPLEWWRQVRVPVLLLYGADDRRVPARESAVRITATVARGSSAIDLTTRILPGADHTFRQAPGAGGWPATARDYLPTLLDWITARR